MQTIAILAPPLAGIPPEKCERARTAMMHQMMLIARGLPVDHPAVRSAAAIVESALAPDPVEVRLADPPAPATKLGGEPRPPSAGASEAYARYLKTILTTQPRHRA